MSNDSLNDLAFSNNPSPTNKSTSRPQIYIAVATYQQGKFQGRWINMPQEIEIIHYEIRNRLSDNPTLSTDNFIIHDSEPLGSLGVRQYENIDTLQEKMLFLLEHDIGAELLRYFQGDINNATAAMNHCYCGFYESELAYTIQVFDKHYLGAAPEKVKNFLDYERLKETIFSHDYFSLIAKGKCHVFRRR